jgi:SP family galactose:H+ symporter-like MFS transporter
MTPSGKGTSRFIYVIAGISALGGLLFGYDTGVISGAILFIRQDFSLSDTVEEIVVSSVLLGALIGAAFGGVLADRWGRRRVLVFAALIFILGAIGTSLAPTIPLLITGRVVVGSPSVWLPSPPRFTFPNWLPWANGVHWYLSINWPLP